MLSMYFLFCLIIYVSGNKITDKQNYEEEKFRLIRNIIDSGDDRKGWTNFLTVGNWPDSFYDSIRTLPFTFIVANDDTGQSLDEKLCYPVNTVVMDCANFEDFEKKIKTAINIPYWHPHANTIVYYHNATETNDIKASIFFTLWYYKTSNALVIQYSDESKMLMINYFNQYISKNFLLEYSYGCWTRNKITLPIRNFQEDIVCIEGCHNVTSYSKFRADHLGTCIGFEMVNVSYDDYANIKSMQLFRDKTKNLHGFALSAFAAEVLPFFIVDVEENGTYTFRGRDGLIWNAMAEVMNFTFDLSSSVSTLKDTFDFELNTQKVFSLDRRKGDLLLFPIYQFDLIILDVDMTIPYKDSGLCFVSHRAGFETNLFDIKLLQSNYLLVIECMFCFFGTWFVFFIFNCIEKNVISFDQAGKDFVNAIRNALSISLHRPPKRESFKIFLFVSIWSFFVLNFVTQAAIISFFSSFKRGKEVDTFDDIIGMGYMIQGVSSPDIMLPQTEEKYKKINAKLVAIRSLFGCVTNLTSQSHRFCLIDCAVGRYFSRNLLNEKGEQYLHIAKDQIHNYYLTMILPRHSALTDGYNRNILRLLQGGFIVKWEEYRYADIKDDASVKSLDMNDLIGIFKCYMMMIGITVVIFVVEVVIGTWKNLKCFIKVKYSKWKRTRSIKQSLKLERKLGIIKLSTSSTQTI